MAFLSAMPGCILCKTHAGGTPVAPQVYANVESWRTPTRQQEISTPEIFGPKCMKSTLGALVAATRNSQTFPKESLKKMFIWKSWQGYESFDTERRNALSKMTYIYT